MILETKLQPPSLKPNTLKRERLLKLLKNNLERKLVLITGDAGYGKTTLLAQVMKEEDLPGVYYGLDRGDSDLVVFASYLVHGLERIQPGLASRVKGLLEQGGEVGKNYELLFGTLINELVEKRKEELFFILDDYHALPEDSLVHQALDYFIDHLPDTVHVVIASRTVPPLPSLSKWRAKEDLFELSREGLKFTEEEVKALLSEVYKLVLSEEEVKRVSEQTEGWITGIRLILQSAGKDGKTVKETLNGYLEANQPLFEYFANEIVVSEPLTVQDFLRKSSILDTMTPEACDKIFGLEGSEELLKSLEKRNLFVSSVGKGEYKFHRLFREFLASRITDEKFKTSLHLKAADYYQRKEQWEQAIEHYLEAGSFEWAGKVIVQVTDGMERQARFSILERWLAYLPKEVLQKNPRLMLVLGRVFREQGRLEEAQRHYEEAEKLFKAQEDSLGLVDVKMNLGALLLFKGACPGAQQALRQASRHCPREGEAKRRGDILKSLGDVLSSQGEHAKAKAYLQKAGAIFESSGNFHDWVEAMSNLATIATFQGEMREASELHRRLIERVETRYWHSVGVLFANAASTALDFGQVEWAEHVLARGLFICRPYEDHRSRATLARVQGFLDIEKGHWVEAELSFHEALEEFKTIRWGLGEPTVLRDLGRLYRYWGRGEKAQDCLDRAREIVGQTASLFQAFLLPEVGLLALARGQLDQAETVFKESLTLSRRYGAKVPEFLTELGYAELSFARGRAVAAQGWFRKAAGRARAKGYDGILRRELRHSPGLAGIARKVAAAARQKELAAYIVKILAQTGVSPDSSEAGCTLRVKLFGSLRLSLAGGKAVPVKWPTRKEASLFAYLLFHRDRVCPREELINVLWPKSKATAAAKTLWASIFRLKRALAAGLRTAGERGLAGKPQIIHQDKGYGIASSLVFEVDVDEFLRERQKAKELEKEGKAKECRGAYRRCAELYQDDFLPNLGEAWVEERREEYEKHYLHVLKVLARDSFLNQDYEEAAHLLRSYLKRDVYSEDVRRELWKAFKALGRVSYIQKNYKELQRILRRDLSQVPTVETEEFYRQLMIS